MRQRDRRLLLGLLSLLILLLCGALLAPWYVGLRLERELLAWQSALNRSFPVEFKLDAFERDWMQSRFRSELYVPLLDTALRSEQRLIHGPFYLGAINDARSPLLIAALDARPRTAALSASAPIRAWWGWQSGFALDLNLTPRQLTPAIRQPGKQPWRANWRDGEQAGRGWFSLPELRWRGEHPGELRHLDVVLERRGPSVWPAAGVLRVDLGELVLHAEDSVELRDVTLRARAIPDGALLNLDIELAVRSLHVAGRQISAPSLQLRMRHVPRAVWDWLQHGAFRRAGLGQVDVDALITEFLRLLSPQVELEIARAALEVDGLPFEAWLRGSLCNDRDALAPDPRSWLRSVCLRAELASEEQPLLALLERETGRWFHTEHFGVAAELAPEEAEPLLRSSAEAQLSVLTSAGYFQYRDGRYHTELQMRDGFLSVSGQPFSAIAFVR
jgi:hypothetical protein